MLKDILLALDEERLSFFQTIPIEKRIENLVESSFLNNWWVPRVTGVTPRFVALDSEIKKRVKIEIEVRPQKFWV